MKQTKYNSNSDTTIYLRKTAYPNHSILIEIQHKDLQPNEYAEYAKLVKKLEELYLKNEK